MTKPKSDVVQSLAWPTYFLAFLMIATPAADYLTNIWPLRVGDVGWRYGSVGLFAGFLLTPLFGILFAMGAAIALEHRLVLRVLSILNVIAAGLILILIVFFALDAVQVRATIPGDATAEARSMFVTGAVKAVFKFLTYAIGIGWMGVVGIRATAFSGKSGRKPLNASDAPLVRAVPDPESPQPSTDDSPAQG